MAGESTCSWCGAAVEAGDGFRAYEPAGERAASFCRLEHVVPWAMTGPHWRRGRPGRAARGRRGRAAVLALRGRARRGPRAARPPPRRPPDRRRLLLGRPPGRLGEGGGPLAVGGTRRRRARRDGRFPSSQRTFFTRRGWGAPAPSAGAIRRRGLRPTFLGGCSTELVARFGGELRDQRRGLHRLLDVGRVAGAADPRRARPGHGGVGLKRGVDVVDLVLGAEDHHQRDRGGPHPGVERRLASS